MPARRRARSRRGRQAAGAASLRARRRRSRARRTGRRTVAATGVDYTRIWWDARPHPRLGTLEVRIADQPTTSVDAALAALVQALWRLRGRSRDSTRSGPRGGRRPRSCSTLVEPAARELGTWELVETLREPPEALRQLEVGRRDGLEAVAADLVARVVNGLRVGLYPLRLVGARLGRRSAPVVLVVLGIAAGASVVFGGRAGTLVAQDRAVAQAVERIPEGQPLGSRGLVRRPGSERRAVRPCSTGARAPRSQGRRRDATSLVLFRETTSPARSPGLGGVEGLGRLGDAALRPAAGARARPERCEVLRLRGAGTAAAADGLKLVEVGEAVLTTASSSATSSPRPTTRSPTPK